jgi:membrane protein DedA with SNARE-associated domain
MLTKSMFRPRRLLICLLVLLAVAAIWIGLRYWDSESQVFNQYVKGALTDYGPLLLFLLLMASGVGVAIGEDIFIIPAGYLMAQGSMPVFWTIVAAYFGVIMADTLWMLVCKKLSKRILNIRWFRRFMHPRRILEIKHQFDQYGVWVVVISRFIPASRTTVITAAGISKMSTWRFLLAETMSAIPTVICQLGIGYLAYKVANSWIEKMHHISNVIWIVVVVLLVIGALWWWQRSARAVKRRPRAKMSWLLEATGRRPAFRKD